MRIHIVVNVVVAKLKNLGLPFGNVPRSNENGIAA